MRPSDNAMKPCPKNTSGWHIFKPKGKKGTPDNKVCTLCSQTYRDLVPPSVVDWPALRALRLEIEKVLEA